jgi:hypothetical protein
MSLKPYELFDALERGDVVEVSINCEVPQWGRWNGNSWYSHCEYRIAPKKELSLVEELRLCAKSGGVSEETLIKAADRICELERVNAKPIDYYTTDELLAELKRRVT